MRYMTDSLLPIGTKYREASKRFGIVLGVLLGGPTFAAVWLEHVDPSWASSIPYLLIIPGLLIVGFIAVASLVHVGFWCVDGFGDSKQ